MVRLSRVDMELVVLVLVDQLGMAEEVRLNKVVRVVLGLEVVEDLLGLAEEVVWLNTVDRVDLELEVMVVMDQLGWAEEVAWLNRVDRMDLGGGEVSKSHRPEGEHLGLLGQVLLALDSWSTH